MPYIVERIEGEFAVLEHDGQTVLIPADRLPRVREGDVLQKLGDGKFVADERATAERRRSIAERMRGLRKG